MKKILLVDDDRDILDLLKYFLELKGYEPRVSTSCDEALSIFFEFAPDLVLLDVNIGTEDGREMCRKIKSQAEWEHIPVILISANPFALAGHETYGANGVLEKPFDLEKLSAMLSDFSMV